MTNMGTNFIIEGKYFPSEMIRSKEEENAIMKKTIQIGTLSAAAGEKKQGITPCQGAPSKCL